MVFAREGEVIERERDRDDGLQVTTVADRQRLEVPLAVAPPPPLKGCPS
jgi:hypothetical protein